MLPKKMTVEEWNEFIRLHKQDLEDISVALPDRFEYIYCSSIRAVFYYNDKFYKVVGGRGGVELKVVGGKTLNEVFERGR